MRGYTLPVSISDVIGQILGFKPVLTGKNIRFPSGINAGCFLLSFGIRQPVTNILSDCRMLKQNLFVLQGVLKRMMVMQKAMTTNTSIVVDYYLVNDPSKLPSINFG